MNKIKFFVDFDGTVSKSDVIDTLLEQFADASWKEVEEKWSRGEIGSRECLTSQISLLKMTPRDLEKIIRDMPVDTGFENFLKICDANDIPVTIVSDGLDVIIKGILKKGSSLAAELPLYSNKLIWTPKGPQIEFPEGPVCEHACANCKERVIKKLTKKTDHIVFVGDGLSDRYAAKASKLTFAKKKLLKFCEVEKLTHHAYQDFNEIAEWIKKQPTKENKSFARVL